MNKPLGEFDPLVDSKDGQLLTLAIIDTIREPLIVLDEELKIIVANTAFYKKFGMSHSVTHDRKFYDLGNGEWDVPALRTLLEQVIPDRTTIDGYEIVHEFLILGQRTMLINACEIRYGNARKKMLLSIHDATDQRQIEHDLERIVAQKNTLLNEMRHRIANSLQLIASILLLKAETALSKEARHHLEDAHGRIMSVVTVQEHLDPVGLIQNKIDMGTYLTSLCESLAKSMIKSGKSISVTVHADNETVSPEIAVSLGLITTELIINAIKYAFPNREGAITIRSNPFL